VVDYRIKEDKQVNQQFLDATLPYLKVEMGRSAVSKSNKRKIYESVGDLHGTVSEANIRLNDFEFKEWRELMRQKVRVERSSQ